MPDQIQRTNAFRWQVDVIFMGTDEEEILIASDAIDGFKSVLRDVLLSRMSVVRARAVAVRPEFMDLTGKIPKGCLKDYGFESLVQ